MTANVTSKAGKPIREYDGSDPLHEPQPEKFSFLIAVQGLGQSEAYLEAYPKSKKWLNSSVNCEASKLRSNPKIIQRIKYLKELHYEADIGTRNEGLHLVTRIMRTTMGDFDDIATNPATRKQPGLKRWNRKTNDIEIISPLDAVKTLFEAQGYNAPSKHQIAAVVAGVDWEQIREALDARQQKAAQIPAG